jgi:AAHS family cis,cis-muconate transporter-like MFS transporter
MTATDSNSNFDATTIRLLLSMFIVMIVDGIDLQMLALALPNIMKEMNLSNLVGGSLATATMLGMLLGGILGAWLADRIGRVKVCFYSIIVFSIATALIAFSNAFWQILVLRFIAGAFIGACFTPSQTVTAEYSPTKWRATIVGTNQAGWSLGYVVAGIMSSYVVPTMGWRALFLASIVPGIITLVLMLGLKDSPSFLASREAAHKRGKKQNEYGQIWSNKTIRHTFIAWAVTAVFLQFGYYGVNTWLPSYLVKDLGVNLKSMGWFIAGTYTMMVLGKSGFGFLGDRFGRKPIWLIAGLGTAVVLPFFVYSATPLNVAYLLLLAGLLFGAPWGVNGAFMTESFPTGIRATAMGTAHNIGKLGAMAAPMLIGIVSAQYSIAIGIALMGLAYGICGLIPPIFIKEGQYDPKAVVIEDNPSSQPKINVI